MNSDNIGMPRDEMNFSDSQESSGSMSGDTSPHNSPEEGSFSPSTNDSDATASHIDFTLSDGQADVDRFRYELSQKLIEIQPESGVTFFFNHTVKKPIVEVSGQKNLEGTLEKPGNFSIRYMDNLAQKNLTQQPELFAKWTLAQNNTISDYYQYIWQDDHTLIVGPPQGGWSNGKYIWFEFDESLQDSMGNNFLNNEDQVVVAYVRSVTEITINLADVTYLPWESGENSFGDPNDFYVYVSGAVQEKPGLGYVKKIIIYLSSYEDTFIYEIPAGATLIDTLKETSGLIKLGGFKWEPNPKDCGGKWAINLPLRNPDLTKYTGKGAQAVAENRYKWKITATVESADKVKTKASSSKIIYHEIYQPKVIEVICYNQKIGISQLDKKIVYRDGKVVPGVLKFNKSDVGSLNSLIIFLKGDFAGSSTFRYEDSCLNNFSQNFAAEIKQSDYDDQGNIVPQGQEKAEVQLPAFRIDQKEEQQTCLITFRAKTKAGSLILLHLQYTVNTKALELQDVRAVSLSFLDK